MRTMFTAAAFAAALLASTAAFAADAQITLKDHEFSPKELTVPANEKIKLTVKNDSAAPAEFESSQLKREKVVAAHSSITVLVGPLKPGTYKYEDDFHKASTGTIVAK